MLTASESDRSRIAKTSSRCAFSSFRHLGLSNLANRLGLLSYSNQMISGLVSFKDVVLLVAVFGVQGHDIYIFLVLVPHLLGLRDRISVEALELVLGLGASIFNDVA
jgi:hypothetical protein